MHLVNIMIFLFILLQNKNEGLLKPLFLFFNLYNALHYPRQKTDPKTIAKCEIALNSKRLCKRYKLYRRRQAVESWSFASIQGRKWKRHYCYNFEGFFQNKTSLLFDISVFIATFFYILAIFSLWKRFLIYLFFKRSIF